MASGVYADDYYPVGGIYGLLFCFSSGIRLPFIFARCHPVSAFETFVEI